MTSKAIPKSWSTSYRLGDGCSIKHGFAFKGSLMTTDDNQDLPIVVNIVNFQYTGGFRLDPTKIQRYVGTLPDEYVLRSNDVLVVMTCQTPKGEILGIPGRIPRDGRIYLHNQRMGLVSIKDTDALDLRFLYYLFISSRFNAHLFATATGAKILHTSPSRIENYRFSRPPLATQRKIAAILSCYDDLIENNTRRIRILEEMAQLLYREWFVHFRFPGHEGVKMVKGVPEGWEVTKVGNILKRLKPSRAYTAADATESGLVPVIDQSRDAFLGFHNNQPDFIATPQNPMVIFGDHTCKMQMMVEPFSIGPNVVPFASQKDIPIPYLFHLVRDLVETREYKRHWTELTNKTIVIAPNELAQEFSTFAEPAFAQIDALTRQSLNLRRTRDLLLPRLVSGEVDVSELEIAT